MNEMPAVLTAEQLHTCRPPFNNHLLLFGFAGTGKTTAAAARLQQMLLSGIPGDQILVLVPQRTLAGPYHRAAADLSLPAGSPIDIATMGGLGQRMIRLFWPLISSQAGFQRPKDPPVFLTLETAQFFMARIIDPMLAKGAFDTVRLDRGRLLGQILDNLNKAANSGFPHTEIGERLKEAWTGEPARLRVYDDVQEAASQFRNNCLENNLLDYSLQIELFSRYLWHTLLCKEYLIHRYRHLIFDNLEEDVPIIHDMLQEWLPHFDSSCLIVDQAGGFRTFLGADPESAAKFTETGSEVIQFNESFVTSQELLDFKTGLEQVISRQSEEETPISFSSAVRIHFEKYTPQSVDWVCEQVRALVSEAHHEPAEIVILAPYLSDALRFSLHNRLTGLGIPARTHRPSRSLRDEPAARALITLGLLAHPQWGSKPSRFDFRRTLTQCIQDMDLVRADLLAQMVFRSGKNGIQLTPFETIQPAPQERITYHFGGAYDQLRLWLEAYREHEPEPLDVFMSRIFGELLSQPGFGFHQNFETASICARLIESVQKFRRVASSYGALDTQQTGREYVELLAQGIVAAQYLQPWEDSDENAVLIAPANTFLMGNRSARVQFWLDIGSSGWWERLNQPLTHPYVLSRRWLRGTRWGDVHEYQVNQQSLMRLINGLVLRCHEKIILTGVTVNEGGEEQRGPLLMALQSLLRRYPHNSEVILA